MSGANRSERAKGTPIAAFQLQFGRLAVEIIKYSNIRFAHPFYLYKRRRFAQFEFHMHGTRSGQLRKQGEK